MAGPHGEERTSERGKGCRWTRRGGSSSYVPFESLAPAWPGYMYVPLSYTPIIVPLIIYNWRPRLIGFDRRSIGTCRPTGPVRSDAEVRGVRIGGVGSAQRRSWKEICPELSPLTSHYFICIQSRPFPRYCNRVSR